MTSSGRIPLRLAEEARIYQQQVRLARAREGVYLNLEASPDSACVLLHALEGLANWPKTLRIGLYEGSLDGRRMAAIGPEQEPELALLWRQQKPGDFCQALFDTLPGMTRERLGITDAAGLRHALQEQPLPAQRLREWLGMQAVKPAFRSPMRLADGRIGHPLSGRGTPFFTEDELLDRLRLLELDDIYVEDALQALYRNGMDRAAINTRLDQVLEEMRQLRTHLDRWVQLSIRENLSEARQRSRERIGAALWEHWRRNLLPELGRPGSPLMLERVQLADLPLPLPEFFLTRVDALLLDEVMLREGEGEERLVDDRTIQVLARQFPALTSLDVHGGEWAASMVQNLVRAWPQLAGLGLREQDVMLGYTDLRSVAGLPRLRRLDLSGSFLL
ncbi:MAG TPA: hypothetical protein DIT18_10440, partial [Pseudomonas sp.]|nr:hypothetical protein [Pseudomonas sp.]